MQMTRDGLKVGCGLHCEPGTVFIFAANRTNVLVVGVDILTNQELPDLSDIAPPGGFWHCVSEAIDAANSAESKQDLVPHVDRLTIAVFAKMGAVDFRNLRELTNHIREQRKPLVMAIVCLAGSAGDRAAGGLLTIPMPIIQVPADEPA